MSVLRRLDVDLAVFEQRASHEAHAFTNRDELPERQIQQDDLERIVAALLE